MRFFFYLVYNAYTIASVWRCRNYRDDPDKFFKERKKKSLGDFLADLVREVQGAFKVATARDFFFQRVDIQTYHKQITRDCLFQVSVTWTWTQAVM